MLQTRSIQAFHDEIVRALALGADFLVVHPGARGEATTGQAIATIVESVKQASKGVPLGGLNILPANTAAARPPPPPPPPAPPARHPRPPPPPAPRASP